MKHRVRIHQHSLGYWRHVLGSHVEVIWHDIATSLYALCCLLHVAQCSPPTGEGFHPVQVPSQKQGRFEVYEGDAVPMSPPQANGQSLMEKHLAKPGTPDPTR